MSPEDGYPTDEELETIEKWPLEKGYDKLMEFVYECWWSRDWGWQDSTDGTDSLKKDWPAHSPGELSTLYYISTGGWSGNESIIEALSQNFMFWSQCWVNHRTGGHFHFEVPERLHHGSS
jgi:hypothetical protein